MLEFSTAVAEATAKENDEDYVEFKIDDQTCRAYRPSESQIVWAVTSTSKYTPMNDKVAGIIDFFIGILDEPSQEYVVARLLDRRDSFGITNVEEIIRALIAEWSGRPTEQPSDSSS